MKPRRSMKSQMLVLPSKHMVTTRLYCQGLLPAEGFSIAEPSLRM